MHAPMPSSIDPLSDKIVLNLIVAFQKHKNQSRVLLYAQTELFGSRFDVAAVKTRNSSAFSNCNEAS